MIEGSLRDPLMEVLREVSREPLVAAGAAEDAPLETGLYRLEFLCTPALTPGRDREWSG